MHTQQRTGGMIAVGILNIVFGSIGSLAALVTMIGGGALAALGSAAGDEGGGATTAGGALAVIGLVALAFSVMLVFAGIGVLMMRPWGRALSLAAAALWLISSLGQMFMLGDVGVSTLVGMVYPVVLVGLFMTAKWKSAYSGLPHVDIPADGAAGQPQSEEMRPAA